MSKLNYVYTDGLEAIYVDGELQLVDEIVDTERALKLLNMYQINEVQVHRIDDSVFEMRYGYEFPYDFGLIFKDDLINTDSRLGLN